MKECDELKKDAFNPSFDLTFLFLLKLPDVVGVRPIIPSIMNLFNDP